MTILVPADVDAGEARRLLVAADGVDVAAEGGEAQHRAVEEDGGEEEEAGDRDDAPDEAAQDVELGHGVGAGVDGQDGVVLAGGEAGDAEGGHHHREGDDEGLQAAADDDDAVDGAEEEADGGGDEEDAEDAELGRDLRQGEPEDEGDADECRRRAGRTMPRVGSRRVSVRRPTAAPVAATLRKRKRVSAARTTKAVERQRGDAHGGGGGPAGDGEEHGADDRAERHDRADREVDAGGQDHRGHAGGDEAGDGDLAQHVEEVAVGEEDVVALGGDRRGEDADQEDGGEAPPELAAGEERPHQEAALQRRGEVHDRLLAGLGAGELAGLAALGHDEDAVGEEQELGELGGDHEDGEALGGERADERVDLLLGADVDAAGGLVEEEDARAGGEPLADDDLLLVAAGEGGGGLGDAGAADAEAADGVVGDGGLAGGAADAEAGDARRARAARRCRGSRRRGAGPRPCGPR